MFRTRLLSGIILLAIAIFTMLSGGWFLIGALLFISEIGLFELYRVMKFEKSVLGILGYIATFLWYWCVYDNSAGEGGSFVPFLFVIAVFTLACLTCFVLQYPKYSAVQLFAAVFGMIYVPVMISYIYRIREEVYLGKWLVFLVLIASWVSDTCAYCVGRLFGKHKLAPVLSPKKSIEGSIGGIAGSAILGAVFAAVMCARRGEPAELIWIFALIGACGSVISQIGDLAASGIKRNYDVKDYGTLIPGHGGILDRFDSVIITAPIVFYLSEFLMMGEFISPMLK